ncbi:MAG: ABC-three component system protein [Candidatus Pacearchaeota archaeon]
MEHDSLFIARIMFQNEIYKSNGQTFEDFFVKVMGLHNPNFRPVKPQGKFGDRKNDGFDSTKGVYYQVYAPEDIKLKEDVALKKLKEDFQGLCDFWDEKCKIREFYYVINDKYKGAHPTTEEALSELKKKYSGKKFDLFLSKHLEDIFIKLSDDNIIEVVGLIPSPKKIEDIGKNFSVLKEVVNFILEKSEPLDFEETYPDIDFDDKIKFNNLNPIIASLLIKGNYQAHVVDDYFSLNSDFAKQELQKKFKSLYDDAKKRFDIKTQADLIFFDILKKVMPKEDKYVQDAALVLMAYYFEACDIFEEVK